MRAREGGVDMELGEEREAQREDWGCEGAGVAVGSASESGTPS